MFLLFPVTEQFMYFKKVAMEKVFIPSIFQMINMEIQQNALKMFFEAGGIPDHADNDRDFEVLTG